MTKEVENLSYEERLKESSLFSLENAREDLITIFQYIKGGYRDNGDSVFIRSHTENTWDNVYKMHQKRFYVDVTKIFFTIRTIIHWNNLLRDVVNVSLQVLKMC